MIYLLVFFLYFYILQDHHLGRTECKCKNSVQPPFNLVFKCAVYSTSCYFQITERFMNWSSKCENRRHNNPELEAYQIITNKEYVCTTILHCHVKCADLCHNFLFKVTKKRLISGNYCRVNHTPIIFFT